MNYRQVFAWASYDLANTAFSALFVTFFFPFYVKEFLGGTEFHIGLVFGLSMLFVGFLVPFFGAWSDAVGKRVPFILCFTVLCCAALVAVGYVPLGYALLAGGIANFFYHAALTTYNAVLPSIALDKNMGWVSGIGIGLGYLGTLLSLLMATILLAKYGWESQVGAQAVFMGTAVFFLLFAGIMFVFLKELPSRARLVNPVSEGVAQIRKTVREVRKHAQLLWFMLTMLLFGDGMNAVIIFLFLYARSVIGMPVKGFMVVYAVFSLAAMVGAFGAGKAVDRFGAKKTLQFAGVLWMAVIVLLLYVKNLEMFVVAGSIGGIALGTVWTAMRPLTVHLSPRKNIGQFFGYMELTDKFSGVLGPIVFGYLAAQVNYTAALLSLLAFFGLGMLALRRVVIAHEHG
ncbi:MFS transporter [Candidatus Woesearchaeota archaeon]|nr:MFS transporter [Candidatus Woesearchaeota archaeon]